MTINPGARRPFIQISPESEALEQRDWTKWDEEHPWIKHPKGKATSVDAQLDDEHLGYAEGRKMLNNGITPSQVHQEASTHTAWPDIAKGMHRAAAGHADFQAGYVQGKQFAKNSTTHEDARMKAAKLAPYDRRLGAHKALDDAGIASTGEWHLQQPIRRKGTALGPEHPWIKRIQNPRKPGESPKQHTERLFGKDWERAAADMDQRNWAIWDAERGKIGRLTADNHRNAADEHEQAAMRAAKHGDYTAAKMHADKAHEAADKATHAAGSDPEAMKKADLAQQAADKASAHLVHQVPTKSSKFKAAQAAVAGRKMTLAFGTPVREDGEMETRDWAEWDASRVKKGHRTPLNEPAHPAQIEHEAKAQGLEFHAHGRTPAERDKSITKASGGKHVMVYQHENGDIHVATAPDEQGFFDDLGTLEAKQGPTAREDTDMETRATADQVADKNHPTQPKDNGGQTGQSNAPHKFQGTNLKKCKKCGKSMSAQVHKQSWPPSWRNQRIADLRSVAEVEREQVELETRADMPGTAGIGNAAKNAAPGPSDTTKSDMAHMPHRFEGDDLSSCSMDGCGKPVTDNIHRRL